MSKSRTQHLKEQGLCIRCGTRKSTTGATYCEPCRAYAREYAKKRRAQKLASKTCIRCSNAALENKNYCQSCLDKIFKNHTNRHERLIAQGLCVSCAKQPAAYGYKKCTSCHKKHTASRKRRHQIQTQQGICTQCGQPHTTGKSICDNCRILAKQRVKHIRKERKEKGLCPRCGKEPLPDKIMCESCLSKSRERAKKKSESSENYAIKKRDNFRCRLCGREHRRLIAHHIDGSGRENGLPNPNSNESLENKITLCYPCHTSLHDLARRSLNTEFTIHLLQSLMSG